MEETYFTIGMAGHIDHGKTTLTKKLTNVDTDRLKEEKERGISIESGYAPLDTEEGMHISVVDVPGHERFIRQMIAGVAGIDLVVLVVAADEGIMPQTQEHLEILQFLGIEHCIIVISKIDRVDEVMLEIVMDDIKERLDGTIFQDAPYVKVDSVSGKGIEKLKKTLFTELKKVKFRDAYGSFRLPIDQVFSVQGQGTVVRGTIYEGIVQKSSQLTILPKGIKVKARQIQVHHEDHQQARAGQRTAINLGGVDKESVSRGDVLVASDHFLVTDTIDVVLHLVEDRFFPLKQRAPVKVHVGTSEVMGKIVFFDRNELEQSDEEILCQIRLDEEVVVRRGDRFILRRPTPVETLGGGWVIQPKGGKYRFGEETIHMLRSQQRGTPKDLITDVLTQHILLDLKQLIQLTSLDEQTLSEIIYKELAEGILIEVANKYSLTKMFTRLTGELSNLLENYHEKFPLRSGMSKAELVQSFSGMYPKPFIEYSLNRLLDEHILKKSDQFILLASFQPHLPPKWKVRMEQIIATLEKGGIETKKWEEYFEGTPIPKSIISEMTIYLISGQQAFRLMEDTLVHRNSFDQALAKLKLQTAESFGLKEAKDALNVSRKYLVPFLELLDELNYTTRLGDKRYWQTKSKSND